MPHRVNFSENDNPLQEEYNSPMLNEIMPSVYKRLRQEAGLTKKDLAPLIQSSRYTVTKFENGTSLPKAAQVEKLLELARCTQQRGAEMVCEELGKRIDRQVRVLPRDAARVSATLLAKGEILVSDYGHRLSPMLLAALRAKIKTSQLMGLANEGNNAELQNLVEQAMKELEIDDL